MGALSALAARGSGREARVGIGREAVDGRECRTKGGLRQDSKGN